MRAYTIQCTFFNNMNMCNANIDLPYITRLRHLFHATTTVTITTSTTIVYTITSTITSPSPLPPLYHHLYHHSTITVPSTSSGIVVPPILTLKSATGVGLVAAEK